MIGATHTSNRRGDRLDTGYKGVVDPQQPRSRQEVGPRPSSRSRGSGSVDADLGEQLVLTPNRCGVHVSNDDTRRISPFDLGGDLCYLASPSIPCLPPRTFNRVGEMHVEHIERSREAWPGTRLEPGNPRGAVLHIEPFDSHRMFRRDAKTEQILAGFEMAMRKGISNNRSCVGTHLLGADGIRIGVCDDPAQIVGDGAVEEQVDRHDSEQGHESGRLPTAVAESAPHTAAVNLLSGECAQF